MKTIFLILNLLNFNKKLKIKIEIKKIKIVIK